MVLVTILHIIVVNTFLYVMFVTVCIGEFICFIILLLFVTLNTIYIFKNSFFCIQIYLLYLILSFLEGVLFIYSFILFLLISL